MASLSDVLRYGTDYLSAHKKTIGNFVGYAVVISAVLFMVLVGLTYAAFASLVLSENYAVTSGIMGTIIAYSLVRFKVNSALRLVCSLVIFLVIFGYAFIASLITVPNLLHSAADLWYMSVFGILLFSVTFFLGSVSALLVMELRTWPSVLKAGFFVWVTLFIVFIFSVTQLLFRSIDAFEIGSFSLVITSIVALNPNLDNDLRNLRTRSVVASLIFFLSGTAAYVGTTYLDLGNYPTLIDTLLRSGSQATTPQPPIPAWELQTTTYVGGILNAGFITACLILVYLTFRFLRYLAKMNRPGGDQSKTASPPVNLAQLAKEFEAAGFIGTASQINELSTKLPGLKSVEELRPEFEKVTRTFAAEWRTGSSHRKEILDIAYLIISPTISKPEAVEVINGLELLFENRRKSEDTIREIARLSRAAQSTFQGFILLCFVYVMAMEGVIDESARFFLIMADSAKGTRTKYETIADLAYGDLKSRMQPHGADFVRVIFDGHEPHLRNSIAHARFSYQDSTAKMTFEDFDPNKQAVSWGPQEMTYGDLLEDYYQKLEDTSTFVSLLIGILQIRGLAYAQVANRTKSSP